jgi:hypothetical protein
MIFLANFLRKFTFEFQTIPKLVDVVAKASLPFQGLVCTQTFELRRVTNQRGNFRDVVTSVLYDYSVTFVSFGYD